MKFSVVLAMLLRLASAGPTPAAEVQVQSEAPWNLRAISHRQKPSSAAGELPRDYKYYYQSWTSSDSYYAYIIDSGIRISHKEFEGRAENLWTVHKTSDGEDDFEDRFGHGTHVAGIVAAKTYGVAKTAKVVAISICDLDGDTLKSLTIKGLELAIADIVEKNRHNHAVINISIGGEFSDIVNYIIEQAYSRLDDQGNPAGILIVAASGNDGVSTDACSPASSHHAITVGAITEDWGIAVWSNFGKSVDIIAPGEEIVSLSNETDTETEIMSGTSMAAPHVAALALNAMAFFSKTSTQVRQFLVEETATKHKIEGYLVRTPNRLVNNNNGKQGS